MRGAFGEDNVIEHRLHQRLREATERLGSRQHKAYTAVLEHQYYSATIADPRQPMTVALGEENTAVRIPI